MTELSVIIPTLNAASMLSLALASLAPNGSHSLIKELLVIDGGSTDGTRDVAIDEGATFIICDRGRGKQMHFGANAASGNWLLFLHADTVLKAGWSSAVKSFIADPKNYHKVGYFKFALDDESANARRLERIVAWRNRVLGLPYGDQGLLISKVMYNSIGGYRDFPLMEDVAIARRIGRRQFRCLSVEALTSAVRYQRDGYLIRCTRNLLCLSLYYLGIPTRIIKWVYK